MRSLVLSIILLLATTSYGATVTCYSQGRMIYSGKVKDVIHNDGIFGFVEKKSGRVILTSGDCVVAIAK
jgi:hypothetical protein